MNDTIATDTKTRGERIRPMLLIDAILCLVAGLVMGLKALVGAFCSVVGSG